MYFGRRIWKKTFKLMKANIKKFLWIHPQRTKTSSIQKKKWNWHFAGNYCLCPWMSYSITCSPEIRTLAIASGLFIKVDIICDFTVLPVMYILLSPQEEDTHSSFWVDRCTHLGAHASNVLTFRLALYFHYIPS